MACQSASVTRPGRNVMGAPAPDRIPLSLLKALGRRELAFAPHRKREGERDGALPGSIPGRSWVDPGRSWGQSLAQCGLAELGDERACLVQCDARLLQELGVARKE